MGGRRGGCGVPDHARDQDADQVAQGGGEIGGGGHDRQTDNMTRVNRVATRAALRLVAYPRAMRYCFTQCAGARRMRDRRGRRRMVTLSLPSSSPTSPHPPAPASAARSRSSRPPSRVGARMRTCARCHSSSETMRRPGSSRMIHSARGRSMRVRRPHEANSSRHPVSFLSFRWNSLEQAECCSAQRVADSLATKDALRHL